MKKTPHSGSGKKYPEKKSGKPASGSSHTGKPKRRFDGEARFKKTYGSMAPDTGRRDKDTEDTTRPARRNHGGDKFADRKAAGKNAHAPKGRPQSGSREVFDSGRKKPASAFSDRKSRTTDGAPDRKRFNSDRFQREFERPERTARRRDEDQTEPVAAPAETGPMPLNKYIAHSGESSRRDAAALVKQGKARVNGELILDPGHKVMPGDKVTLAGKKLQPRRHLVYVLLNKPKGFLTTTDDPKGRKTVMSLVAHPGDERLFPVGRLDRNTTGLLLLTNDGDLAQKLSHPSYQVKKVYQVTLDKPLTKADFDKVLAGVKLEDGVAPVDSLAYLEEKNDLGIEIHSGRNRIVRRIFESLGYEVVKLDRVMYAGLTKKNIPRGKWRFLSEREIVLLRHFKN